MAKTLTLSRYFHKTKQKQLTSETPKDSVSVCSDFAGFNEKDLQLSKAQEEDSKTRCQQFAINTLHCETKLENLFEGFTRKEQDLSCLEQCQMQERFHRVRYKIYKTFEVSSPKILKTKTRRPNNNSSDEKNTNIKPTASIVKVENPFYYDEKKCFVPVWIPPKSPHNLLEEDLYYDPWALLVATIFLNRTSCKSARPCVFWFLGENPHPSVVLEKKPKDLEKYFEKLGLQKTRAMQVWKMTYDFVYKKWKKVKELYGVGRYAEDAFKMFCLGDFTTEPKDRFLRIYKAWYEMKEKKERLKEMNS